MTNNVIKFPESLDKAWARIDRKFETQLQKYQYETKRLNWFAGGFTVGAVLTITVFFGVYAFIGFP